MPNSGELRAAADLVEKVSELATAETEAGARLGRQVLGLLVTNTKRIHVKSADGDIEQLTPVQFHETFGVTYAPRLIYDRDYPRPDLSASDQLPWPRPDEDRRAKLELSFGLKLGQKPSLLRQDIGLKEWLYGDKIRQSYTANTYIAKVDDEIGHGLFAAVDIAPGKMIGEYTGIARGFRNDDLQNPYIFSYGTFGGVDAREVGNYTRFINHSQSAANANSVRVLVDHNEHVVFVATKDVRKGEQILFDYGEGYWTKRTAPREF